MHTDGSTPELHPMTALVAPLAVVFGYAAMLLTGSLAPALVLTTDGRAPLLGLRSTLIACELALASPALLALALPAARPILGLRRIGALTLLAAAASGAALWAASLGVLELQYAFWAPPPGYLQDFQRLHEALRPHGALDLAFSITAIAVSPAVCEELLFRGLALPALRPAIGTAGAVAGSSVLFALIHLDFSSGRPTLYRVPFALVVGVGFALLRLRTGSLLPSMLAHALVNTTTFLAALQETAGTDLPPSRPLFGAAMLAAGVISFAVVLGRLPRAASPSPNPARLENASGRSRRKESSP